MVYNHPMTLLPRAPYQRKLFTLLLVLIGISCVNPPYLQFLLMQHVPTVFVLGVLVWFCNRFTISRFSFTSAILFLSLHTLGARYLCSYVPYDDWSEMLFGTSISDLFGFERNHYDRLVHFSYGLLLAIPIQEFEQRYFNLPARLAGVLAIECILATSAVYEIIEWLIAAIFAADWADSFLGQQGDIFDAHKDMALAALGAVIAVAAAGRLKYLQPL